MTDCERLRDSLLAGQETTPSLEEHASECEACAELVIGSAELGRALGEAGREGPPPSDVASLLKGLQDQVAQERGVRAFTRSRPTSQRIALVLAGICGIGLLHLGSLLRADAAVYPAARLAFELALLGVVALGSAFLGLRPHFKTSAPLAASIGIGAAAALVPVMSIVMGPAHADHAASLAGLGEALIPRAGGCFAYGLIFALPVLVVAWLVDRGPAAGVAFAFAGAATVGANLALWLHCPITHAAHLALGHVPVGLCLLGAAVLVWQARRRAI